MSVQELAEKRVEEAPVKETKKSNVVQQKLISVIFIWVAFVVLYLAVSSGSETMMWAGLGLTIVSAAVLYMRN